MHKDNSIGGGGPAQGSKDSQVMGEATTAWRRWVLDK